MKKIIEVDGIKYQKVEPTRKEEIIEYVKKHPLLCNGPEDIKIEDDYIKLPLPNSNDEWTFEVWDWVRNFVKVFREAYPTHRDDQDCSNYQYISI